MKKQVLIATTVLVATTGIVALQLSTSPTTRPQQTVASVTVPTEAHPATVEAPVSVEQPAASSEPAPQAAPAVPAKQEDAQPAPQPVNGPQPLTAQEIRILTGAGNNQYPELTAHYLLDAYGMKSHTGIPVVDAECHLEDLGKSVLCATYMVNRTYGSWRNYDALVKSGEAQQ